MVSITVLVSERTATMSRLVNSFASKLLNYIRRGFLIGSDFTRSLNRERKFTLGLILALWPVFAAVFVPPAYSDRLPLVIFCIAALTSEAMAAWLFIATRRRAIDRPEDRLTSWSVVGAAAAGAGTVAFLITTVANLMHVW